MLYLKLHNGQAANGGAKPSGLLPRSIAVSLGRAALAETLLQLSRQRGQYLIQIAHHAIRGSLEDRRVGVAVDGDDHLAALMPAMCWIAPLMPTAAGPHGLFGRPDSDRAQSLVDRSALAPTAAPIAARSLTSAALLGFDDATPGCHDDSVGQSTPASLGCTSGFFRRYRPRPAQDQVLTARSVARPAWEELITRWQPASCRRR